MAIFRRDDSDSAALIVWGSVTLTMLRLSLEASHWLILWQVYGRRTVAHDHLSIVRSKPQLVVSNGDVLRGLGAMHYLYGVGLWLPLTFAVLVPLMKYGAPAWWKRASTGLRAPDPKGSPVGLVALLAVFFAIPGFLPLVPALTMGGVAAVVGLWWLRNSMSDRDSLVSASLR